MEGGKQGVGSEQCGESKHGVESKHGEESNSNIYLKSNIQTSSMDCTYKLIKYQNKYHVNVQVK